MIFCLQFNHKDFALMTPQILAAAIRFLAMDAIAAANSGHPGAPLGMADMATVLWTDFLKHNPANPDFYDRDRFILSNGHASMLLYSLLHLSGYDLSIDDLKNFRGWQSKTPGHPEYGHTPGVETTTGPLGQGFANAVGMALAEKLLAADFNTAEFKLVDHFTYVFVGDGCLMEGISHEAASIAGTLGLGKLITFYDDNNISIDGKVNGWFTENIPERFKAYGWQVIAPTDGHDYAALTAAVTQARQDLSRPTLICCKTTIAQGAATMAGSAKTHGSPLSKEEIAATRKALNWNFPPFVIPPEIYKAWDAKEKGQKIEQQWQKTFQLYQQTYPERAAEFIRRAEHRLPDDFAGYIAANLDKIQNQKESIATRKASQNSIALMAAKLPELLGGSADLTPSNLTSWPGAKSVSAAGGGNYIHYGVREFAMAAMVNGLFLHGGVRPFGATFLMFSEYARNAVRMAALMGIGSVFIFTHDSIGLGEDGPTHQPIEQIATLRQIPRLDLWRPCDTVETFIAWTAAVKTTGRPTVLVLSRQNLPYIPRDKATTDLISRGGYILKAAAKPQAVIISTGSEVQLATAAQAELKKRGIAVNVVSMPCSNIFDRQDKAYRQLVLPPALPKIALEAGISDFWYKYLNQDDTVIGINDFASSAPAETLFNHYGFTVENVVNTVSNLVRERKK